MAPYSSPSSEELHLLFTLSDSALPTGGFIASSGLESFAKHGFLPSFASSSSSSPTSIASRAITEFAHAEVEHYASTTSPFLVSAYKCLQSALEGNGKGKEQAIDGLVEIDYFHEAAFLSHVSRRSSKAQGVALLTLFSRGLTQPPGFESSDDESDVGDGRERDRQQMGRDVIEGYKRLIRARKAMGHLAVCWGVMTAALGLSLGQSSYLPSLFVSAP